MTFIMMGAAAAATHLVFSIERSKDSTGANTNDGLMVLGSAPGAAAFSAAINRYLRFSSNTFASSTILGAWAPTGTTWASFDATNRFGFSPVRFFNGQPSNPCISWIVYMNGDLPAGTQLPFGLYGANHTFLTIGTTTLTTAASGNANSTMAILFE
jgi:hypothetical protein